MRPAKGYDGEHERAHRGVPAIREGLMNLLKRVATSLSVIVVFAFAIRILLFWAVQIHGKVPIINNMPFGYETGRIARSIAEGKGFSSPLSIETGPTIWLTPIFPYLLAGVFKVFGVYTYKSMLMITALNDAFSALTCIPVFFIAKRVGGLGLAAGAAWLWAIFPNAILMPFEWIWDTSLAALMAALILWATLSIRDSKRVRDWIGYGLLCGVGLMVNASIVALAPFLLFWLAMELRKKGWHWIQLPAITLILMGIVCVPWTVRNYIVFHRVIIFRSNFGLELWLGNNEQVPDTWAGFLHPNDYPPEREKFARLGEIEYMRQKQSEAIQFMESHPRDTMRFFWRRFVDNWMGSWDPIQDVWHTLPVEGRITLAANLFLSVFGLMGLLFMYREKNPYAFPIAMFPLIYPIVYYITHSSLRYRHPIDPAMVVVATYAVAYPMMVMARRKREAQAPAVVSET
jgi:4-amino-4-deoxy-L-arabinose transferase-like glycosyltransferase